MQPPTPKTALSNDWTNGPKDAPRGGERNIFYGAILEHPDGQNAGHCWPLCYRQAADPLSDFGPHLHATLLRPTPRPAPETGLNAAEGLSRLDSGCYAQANGAEHNRLTLVFFKAPFLSPPLSAGSRFSSQPISFSPVPNVPRV